MIVWVVTLYVHDRIKMYEFDNKEEAQKQFDNLTGCKILSEVIYFTDFEDADVMPKRELAFAPN